ncbi:hypothetical protein FBU31_006871, partial [Coemansia sp. 'formosensis']
MASNESFDVSVRHSDPSESTHSSESSFLTELQQENAASTTTRGHVSLLDGEVADDDDDDDDDDLDENDGDDDAVTMELTGTVDMGVMNAGGDDSDDDDDDNNLVG